MTLRKRGPAGGVAGTIGILAGAALLGLLGAAAVAGGAPQSGTALPNPEGLELFEKQIRPILHQRCVGCHGARSRKPGGGLVLDVPSAILRGGDRGAPVRPGKPDESILIQALRYEVKGLLMPPTGKLPEEQLQHFVRWVELGAPVPSGGAGTLPAAAGGGTVAAGKSDPRRRHWSFLPLRPTPIPAVRDSRWASGPVDRYVLSALENKGLRPAPRADRRTWIRRVTFDLVGLPPTPAEVQAYVEDRAPGAEARVVDRLLSSPHFGERWGRHWLDLVRYAETDGHEFDFDKTGAHHYRDYVIRALNADVPYDQFVTEHIAGDLLPKPRTHPEQGFNESVLGTGFWWLGEGKHSPVDLREEQSDQIANQLDVFSKTFLGLALGCARCHDHKFDPLPAKDYYALFGYLKSSRFALVDVHSPAAKAEKAAKLSEIAARVDAAEQSRLREALKPWSAHLDQLLGTAAVNVSAAPAPLARAWSELRTGNPRKDGYGPFPHLAPRLRSLGDSARLATLRKEMGTSEPVGLTPFAEFDGSDFGGWRTDGEAFGARPTNRLSLHLASPGSLVEPGSAYSAGASDRLTGALRSPSFTINKPFILYRAAGKDCKSNLIIDGFQRIRAPLYGGLTVGFDHGPQYRWVVQDVSKFIGHRAYIELIDPGFGWMSVDRIAFADRAAPDELGQLVARLAAGADSLASLNRAWREYARATEASWENGELDRLVDRRSRVDFLNWALTSPELTLVEPEASCAAPSAATAADLAERKQLEETIAAPDWAMSLVDGYGEDEPVHVRGSHKTPGIMAPRSFLQLFTPAPAPAPTDSSGRLILAKDLLTRSRGLAARVVVNRVWQHYFGEGLVRTPDDFGLRGEKPSHPELLEYLANRLSSPVPAGFGWRLKPLHRLIALSAVYGMSSKADAAGARLDPQNRLLHRMPVRRLEAEAIRDSVLALSGHLDRTMFGPGVMPHLTAFMDGRGRPGSSGPLDGAGRRSVYLAVRRNFLTPMFLAFDFPIPFSTMGKRTVSTVPAQALVMMNNPFILNEAARWAGKIQGAGGDAGRRVEELYQSAFGRPPTASEAKQALTFLQERGGDTVEAWTDVCHALFNLKEFCFLY